MNQQTIQASHHGERSLVSWRRSTDIRRIRTMNFTPHMKSGDCQLVGDRLPRSRSVWVVFSVAIVISLLMIPNAEWRNAPNDFAFYWTAAKLVLAGGNPYSPQETVARERQMTFTGKGPLVMLNPPWILPLIVPFGLVAFSLAKSCWLVISVILLAISVQWLWDLYGDGHDPWVGWLLTATLLPVAVVLIIGQIGPLLLFGLAGFLRFDAKQRFMLAGTFLFLTSLKPHLVFLLWPALLLDGVYRRRWKSPVALGAMLAGSSLLGVLLDHRAFQQYLELFSTQGIALQETPTIAGLLRHISGMQIVQFLPAAAAGLWFAFYWFHRRSDWNWRSSTPTLLLISTAATTYAWFFDQVVLLPAVFQTAMAVIRSRRRLWLGAGAVYLAINYIPLAFLVNHRPALWYSWTGAAWLILAVVARKLARKA